MQIKAFSYTNKGGRDHNEDSIALNFNDKSGIFVLADGLGGHNCGEVASKMATDSILEQISVCKTINSEQMQEILIETNEQIILAQQTYKDMKTTVTSLFLHENKAIFGYVGDSRIYHFRNGEILNHTLDHSVTFAKYKAGEISYKDIYTDEDRSSLLRVLGKTGAKPQTGEWNFEIGDAFLMCSDGLWEKIYDLEIICDLQKSKTPEQWAKFMLKRNIKTLTDGDDNFSLICVFCD